MSINFCVNDCESVGMQKSKFNKTCSLTAYDNSIEDKNESSKYYDKIIPTLLIIVILVVISIVIFLIANKILKKMKSKNQEEPTISTKNQENKQWIIKQNELILKEVLGRGQFGVVYEGYYHISGTKEAPIKVAIKTITSDENKSLMNDLYQVLIIFLK